MENKLQGLVDMTDAEIDVVAGGTRNGGGGGTNYGIQQSTHAYKSGNQVVKNNGTGTGGSAYASYNTLYNYNYNSGSVTYGPYVT
jgi:hypothetical protein